MRALRHRSQREIRPGSVGESSGAVRVASGDVPPIAGQRQGDGAFSGTLVSNHPIAVGGGVRRRRFRPGRIEPGNQEGTTFGNLGPAEPRRAFRRRGCRTTETDERAEVMVSDEERDMILQMVAENQISTAEAAVLLDALKESEAEEQAQPDWASGSDQFRESRRRLEHEARRMEHDARRMERDVERAARQASRDAFRHLGRPGIGRSLLIHVRDGEETRTNVRIPLGMALAAGKFIPKKARGYLEEYGIDVADLIDSLANDLGRTGDIVNIREGDKVVQISIVGSDSVMAPRPVEPVEAPTPPSPVQPVVPPTP